MRKKPRHSETRYLIPMDYLAPHAVNTSSRGNFGLKRLARAARTIEAGLRCEIRIRTDPFAPRLHAV